MQINIYSIEKSQKDEFETIIKNYISMSKKFAQIKDVIIFNKDIAKAQKNNEAQKAYAKAFEKYLNGYNIILTPEAKEPDTIEFSKLLENKLKVNFFIGGAFGFDDEFKKKGDKLISLSKLTMSHKVAKIVLFEQIYRALSILNNHPYHK